MSRHSIDLDFASAKRPPFAIFLALCVFAATHTRAADPLFLEDFSRAAIGKTPTNFLVMDGQFTVVEDAGNRFLELPGAPLDTFGVMFGPSQKENWSVQARFLGSGKGRRFPVFGVSMNGRAGYFLHLAPAKKSLELLKGEAIQATAPYEGWANGAWTVLRIQVEKESDSSWLVQGKAWKDGTPEPAEWQVRWKETAPPNSGRAAVWGMPYSGTPIRFDDLRITPVEK